MDSENQFPTENLISILGDQIGILFSIISRPVVLLQIFAVLLIIFFTWLFPHLIQKWRVLKHPSVQAFEGEKTKGNRLWLEAFKQLLSPLLALILLKVMIWLFDQLNYPNGLLEDLINIILVWLVYRAAVTILLLRYGSNTRPYLNKILTPIFLFLIAAQILSTWPGGIALIRAKMALGNISFSFASLITAIIVFYLFVISAWIIEQLMIYTLPKRLNVEIGFVESVATLIRYTFLTVGIIVSLGLLGLDFTSLAIVAGGLSVGIGIGLQDIVSNFVSGLVLLFEQSLRPGDVIEFDGRITRVEKISMRATIVRTNTNEELIIPNASFTTQQVINLTKSERLVQVSVPFGVGYNSDPELVRNLAIETSLRHPQVLAEPVPQLMFKAYGESSIDFNLLASTAQPELSLRIRSDLYYMLWKVFAENEITIPFPQRDLNLGTGWNNLAAGIQSN